MKTLVLPSVTDLSHEFPFITKDELKYRRLHNKYKTKKGFFNSLVRINDNYKQRSEKPDVHILEIELEWEKSRTWGYCPVASMRWLDKDGWHYENNFSTASGYGYDKASTVVAECCNAVLSGMLWRKKRTKKQIPYGVSIYNTFYPHFNGGVGMGCYYRIAEFLGGKLEQIANAQMYDKYVFTFKNVRNNM